LSAAARRRAAPSALRRCSRSDNSQENTPASACAQRDRSERDLPLGLSRIPLSDRDLTLRAAEKLLRVGKLDAALAKYQEVLAAQPDDHATAVAAAGLLYRAGRIDEAVERFTAAADALAARGDVEHAADVYRRILAARPADDHALEQSARLASERGDTTAARNHFVALADARLARHDQAGALESLTLAARIDPSPELLDRLFACCIDCDALEQARACATSGSQRRRLARALEREGRHDDAVVLLEELLEGDPHDAASAAQIARLFIRQGDAAAAAGYLTADMAGADPEARLAVAEILCRGGRYEAGLDLIERAVADSPQHLHEAGALAGAVAAHAPEHGRRAIRLVAESLCARSRWADAAAVLEAFIADVPDGTDAIVQLVEVAVDGNLPEIAERAQARLANAYLVSGSAPEAAAILEDLASRHPEQPMYVTQLRQALVLSGDGDPDATLRQRLAAAALAAGTSPARQVEVPPTDLHEVSTVVPFRAAI
jgi:tetratricopeptide (TPR) repeat protein